MNNWCLLTEKKSLKKKTPRSKFTHEEDIKLKELVEKFGTEDWQTISIQMPGRNTRQCRDRWRNYLSPDVVNGPWTKEEDDLLMKKYEELGPSWKKIASFFPTRTDINVKSRWNLKQRRIKKNEFLMINKAIDKRFLKSKSLAQNKKNTEYKDIFFDTSKQIITCNKIVEDKNYSNNDTTSTAKTDCLDLLLMDFENNDIILDGFLNIWY